MDVERPRWLRSVLHRHRDDALATAADDHRFRKHPRSEGAAMTVGVQLNAVAVNQLITNLSVAMRDVLTDVSNLSLNVNGQGGGLAYLESIGFTAGDAATALAAISYTNTIAGVDFGTATPGR